MDSKKDLPNAYLCGGYMLLISEKAKEDLDYLKQVLDTVKYLHKHDEPYKKNIMDYIVEVVFKNLDIKIVGTL